MIRLLDVLFSLIGIIILFPVFVLIGILIKIESKGSIFIIQERIGQYAKPFWLYKLRTMYNDSNKFDLITIGNRDPRITPLGYYLRRFKIDEFPQLINVIKGDMSIVGPRPEVKKYVDLYTELQRSVLDYRPGITDYASIVFRNENVLLGEVENPDDFYVNVIMPVKLRLNNKFIRDRSIKQYFRIIFLTIIKVF
jgi:lipopolysaccharide/colanic/teichoic acid biosynthesis glycosyltransferase